MHSEGLAALEAAGNDEMPGEVVHPVTGEAIRADDVDGLLRAYADMGVIRRELDDARGWIAQLLVAKTADVTTKTRRVRGSKMRAVITMPDDSWDGATLKEAWDRFPQFAPEVLKIERIGVKLREWKKAQNERGGPIGMDAFRELVASANRGATRSPSIAVERIGDGDPRT